MPKRLYYYLPTLDDDDSAAENVSGGARQLVDSEYDANLVSSLCDDGRHMPVIDVDTMPAWKAVLELTESWRWAFGGSAYVDPDWVDVVDSSTPGHCHIYVDAVMTWESYELLLDHLRRRGVIEPGYYRAALARKATFVRPPGVLKPEGAKANRGYRFEPEVA